MLALMRCRGFRLDCCLALRIVTGVAGDSGQDCLSEEIVTVEVIDVANTLKEASTTL